ncbi:hypothetical protein K439DRAFT_1635699 [Ramaria rubella]|nr:hypothetical protein K439DRAFT_1635699 [Ramaria rubella]
MCYYTAKHIRIGLGVIGACLTLIGTAINLFTDANTFGMLKKVLIDGGIILTAVACLIDSFAWIKRCHSFVTQIMHCRSFFARIVRSRSRGAQGFWDIEAAEVTPSIELVDMGNFNRDGLIHSLKNTLVNGE